MNDLHDLLDQVHDRASFLDFVHALMLERANEDKRLDQIDPCGRGVHGWENHSIADFLAAATRWADDIIRCNDERTLNLFPEEPSWRTFARFLYLGKIYE